MIPSLNLKKIKSFVSHSLPIIACLLLLGSCVDENNQLGLNLVQTNGGMDVLGCENCNVSLEAKTFYNGDSLLTANYDNFSLGQYADEYFGKITSTIYTSLELPSTSIDVPNMGEVDSVVLCLAYSGAFTKDTSVKAMNMDISVYELSEQIDSSKKYSSDYVSTQSIPIYSGTVNVNPSQSVYVNNDTLNPHLRLKIDGDFFNRLATAEYASKQDFQEAFKGLKITATCQDVNGMLAYINMKSALSGLRIYFNNNGNSNYTTISFPTSSGKFMHLDYDYTSSAINGIKDTINSDTYIYLACLGVAEPKIDIKGLLDWYNVDSVKGAAINRAELIIPLADISPSTNLIPASINCYRKQDGQYYLLSDEMAVNNWLGNRYDASLNAYRLDITSFIQNYVMGKYDNCVLYLVPDGRMSTARRVILCGPNNNNKPKLNIIYSHPASN